MHSQYPDRHPDQLLTVLPREFKEFRGYHSGETILVCGCGSSLSQIVAPERLITIGVNDVGRLFTPDYLAVLNPRQQFPGDRFRYVEESRAKAIFTQLDLGIAHPHIVRFRLGRRGGTDLSDTNSLPYTRNSPYPALCLAAHMGARRIGLIGVDFTDNHFFASTGRHLLTGELAQIDQEYQQLQQSLAQRGIEIFNLSEASRLTAFPKMTQEEFLNSALSDVRVPRRKVFFVNYRFLSCGNVFRDGLAHAADQLGLRWEAALWDDGQLEERITAFEPDLLFVVHGRKFSGRWHSRFARYSSAVWLLDEPYEVDDTSRFSSLFRTVFVNDPGTLARHHNAHYLPVCYDPKTYTYLPSDERTYGVGFIGGFNPQREEALERLANRGLLCYVVGGPWRSPTVNRLCLAANIPAEETTGFYRKTRIIVNVFRSKHHFNSAHVPAISLNPRIYEGLACGALVISEHRPELDMICPEMPVFRSLEELEYQVERHLRDRNLYERVRRACIRRFAAHTYSNRLATVISTIVNTAEVNVPSLTISTDKVSTSRRPQGQGQARQFEGFEADWEVDADCTQVNTDGSVVMRKPPDNLPGSERGLVGKVSYRNLTLEFEVFLEANTTFLAKIHQAEARNQLGNSYHLMCRGERAYLARHNCVLCNISLPIGVWVPLSFSFLNGTIVVRKSGAQIARAQDRTLSEGYCFLGVKGGAARLRNVQIRTPETTSAGCAVIDHDVLQAGTAGAAKVSIITTAYDRIDCLERCLRSVQALTFKDHEHIIVADAPPSDVLRRIEGLGERYGSASGKLTLANLKERKNDWGISPAAVGLRLARGEYICFLSDDNGYVPDHFEKLLAVLDQDPNIGFVYSSCLYDGRTVLNAPVPGHGKIDLGQPVFRRDLFDRYLGGTLPFRELCWDWRMIETFTRLGVSWRHVDEATFIFRLAKYPHLLATNNIRPTAVSM